MTERIYIAPQARIEEILKNRYGSVCMHCMQLFLLIFFAVSLNAAAAFGAEDECDIIAKNFLKYLNNDKIIVSTRLISANELDSALPEVAIAYLANLRDGGYIVISTSRRLTPIKAYSLKSDFETLPVAYKKFLLLEMEYYTRSIMDKTRTALASAVSENEKRWDFLLNLDKVRMTLAYSPDTYLLDTQWKQGEPYNKFLPEIDGRNVVAGCVNVAVAQVMKYHGYPSAGKSVARYDWNDRQLKAVLYRTYNWENMPDLLNAGQPEYKVDEIALLIRDLAIVHHTSFGLDSSTASINTSALFENFGYSNTITSMSNSDVTLFFETLRSEINAERPVLLSFPGHMVVADGYSSNQAGTEIHVNMGWGGHYDDYYFLDQTVLAGDYTFEPDLTIYYNIKPCSGADCFVNLESEDSIDGMNITGKFDYDTDIDRYDLYLKGDTEISGDRGFSNQAFYISIYDSDNVMVASGNEPMTVNLSANRYTVRVSLLNESGSSYLYDDKTDYVVAISTDTLTEAEKTTINSSLDIAPVINSSLNDILLNSSNPTAHKILIDARDENGDTLNLNISNTNHSALQAVLIGNILELTPVDGAYGIAGKITVIAFANNKSIEKSFNVMVSDENISFGKEFVVTGIFENQEDFNTHKVILDGECSITGYNGYSNQAFYTSVMDTSENIIVSPIDNKINYDCESGIYLLGASLEENPGGYGEYYPYEQGVNDQYRLTVSCPYADDSVANVANILCIDLSGTFADTNNAPAITSTPVATVDEDDTYSYTLTAYDVDAGDELTLSSPTLPGWLSFAPETGVLSGIPTNDDIGDHAVVLRVNDGTVDVDQNFTITVSNTNDAPTITGTPGTGVDEDTAYSFTPTANDIDVGDTLTFTIENKPAWATFDTVTGSLTGTPKNDDVGIYPGIVITVTDGKLTASLPSFNIEALNLIIPGDIDNSGTIDLRDAILDLQILAGLTPEDVNKEADVNGDGKLGLEEAIHALQVVAGLKTGLTETGQQDLEDILNLATQSLADNQENINGAKQVNKIIEYMGIDEVLEEDSLLSMIQKLTGDPFTCGSVEREGLSTVVFTFSENPECSNITGTVKVTPEYSDGAFSFAIQYIDVQIEDCSINGNTTTTLSVENNQLIITNTSENLTICRQSFDGTVTVVYDPGAMEVISVTMQSEYSYTLEGSDVTVVSDIEYTPTDGITGTATITIDGKNYECELNNIKLDPECGIPTSGTLTIDGYIFDFGETTCDNPVVITYVYGIPVTLSLEDAMNIFLGQ